MFENFWGHTQVTRALERMMARERVAQTLLFGGPEGVGKATAQALDTLHRSALEASKSRPERPLTDS